MSASRRTVMKGLAATVGLAALGPVTASAVPSVFDATSYIADMRAAGITLFAQSEFYDLYSADGFGEAYRNVGLKWWKARKAHPDPNGAVFATLEAEKAEGA